MEVKGRRGVALLAAVCTLTLLTASRVEAQTKPGSIKNPPEATIRRAAPTTFGLEATTTEPDSPVGREARLTLVIEMTPGTIFNPANRDPQHPEGQPEKVELRSYRSVPTEPPDPATPFPPFVAPTIRVFPGETVRITLENQLPPEPGCNSADINVPHCFNTTNLHAHGVWVSPVGNSDNVLLTIRPGVTFDYEYNIPADHPAGTFWYHPHRHGSTAMQVGSGMAGALIIQGKRLPSKDASGDLDTLLRTPDGTPFRERVLLFQQIAYACRDAEGEIKKNANGWICDQVAGDVGQVDQHRDIFQVASTWASSGRHTTINGRTTEPFDEPAIAGQLERWRMVHGGVRATLGVSIRKRRPDAQPYDASSADAEKAWISDNCNASAELPYWEIASDGLTRAAADRRTVTVLQPGYRSDVLIVFPEAGDYCVIDGPVSKEASVVSGQATTPRLLTTVTVTAGTPVPDITEHVTQALKTAARTFMPAAIRADIENDLGNGLRLTSFVPHPDLPAATVATPQQLVFGLVFEPPSRLGIGDGTKAPAPYDPTRIDRKLTLGAIEDWTLTATGIGAGAHPFHIHVNPFQILSVVRTSDGADMTADPMSQYARMKGVWKDTVIVQDDVTVTVRTQYRRYIGDFVLHCHILDHEDRGMMQRVRILLPDGQGGQEESGHTHP